MGAKAKKAMSDGEAAIKAMMTNANDLVAAYQGMYNQKKITIQFRKDLLDYAAKKYPGKADLTPEYGTDAAVKRLVDGFGASKVKTRAFRQSIMVGTVTLKQHIATARTAIAELDKLILAKQGKKDSAGSNPLKKLGAAIRTKSLGNMREQKVAIDKAIAECNAFTVAIVAYAEKKLAKQT